jgi:hypothetical protein
MLANSVSMSCGIPMTIPYVAIRAAFDCISSMLMLIFLQKSKLWLITFVPGWLVGAIDGRFHHFKQGVGIDASVVTAVSRPKDEIGDVAANQLGDGFNDTFFGTNDLLIDDIQLVGFLLCLHL